MRIDIVTLFPAMFKGPFAESIVKRAADKGLVQIEIHDLRNWANDKRRMVDDRPFGGGKGMILMVEPIERALHDLKSKIKNKKSKTILLTPVGKVFSQKKAEQLSGLSQLILICGHYEGVDERVGKLVDEEISIGDYILTGGELAAMVMVDCLVRLIPGVLSKEAVKNESFAGRLLEYPQYTRPANFKGRKVPAVLLSGDHLKIEKWRSDKASEVTGKKRPELLGRKRFSI